MLKFFFRVFDEYLRGVEQDDPKWAIDSCIWIVTILGRQSRDIFIVALYAMLKEVVDVTIF